MNKHFSSDVVWKQSRLYLYAVTSSMNLPFRT